MRFLISTITLFLLSAVTSQAQSPCGREGPACETSLGSYRLAIPDSAAPAGGFPAILFFHGAGGSGAGTLKMGGMIKTFTNAGYAVIAPDGLKRPNSRFGPGWSFHPDRPKQRDELEFTRELIGAAKTHGINPDRVTLSGFSIGGSMVWYLACQDHQVAASYAPVAGAFWRPHPLPGTCSGPVKLLHTHGWKDKTVPLEGRPLRSGAILQGDVFHGLDLLRQLNGCTNLRADSFDTDGDYWVRTWETCAPDTALSFALHPGGHSVPRGWAERVVAWLNSLDTAPNG